MGLLPSDQGLVSWSVACLRNSITWPRLTRCGSASPLGPFLTRCPSNRAAQRHLFWCCSKVTRTVLSVLIFFTCGQPPTNKLHFKLYAYVDYLDSGTCFAMETTQYIVRLPRKLDVLKESIKQSACHVYHHILRYRTQPLFFPFSGSQLYSWPCWHSREPAGPRHSRLGRLSSPDRSPYTRGPQRPGVSSLHKV